MQTIVPKDFGKTEEALSLLRNARWCLGLGSALFIIILPLIGPLFGSREHITEVSSFLPYVWNALELGVTTFLLVHVIGVFARLERISFSEEGVLRSVRNFTMPRQRIRWENVRKISAGSAPDGTLHRIKVTGKRGASIHIVGMVEMENILGRLENESGVAPQLYESRVYFLSNRSILAVGLAFYLLVVLSNAIYWFWTD